MDVKVYWPAVFILVYILCGLGFTMQGVIRLADWIKQKRLARQRPESAA